MTPIFPSSPRPEDLLSYLSPDQLVAWDRDVAVLHSGLPHDSKALAVAAYTACDRAYPGDELLDLRLYFYVAAPLRTHDPRVQYLLGIAWSSAMGRWVCFAPFIPCFSVVAMLVNLADRAQACFER